MGARSRKRRRTGGPTAAPVTPPAKPASASASASSAKPAVTVPPPAAPLPAAADPAAAPPTDSLQRGYARGRARADEVRAGLEPLAEGERPGAVTIAAVVAFGFAIANVIAAVTGNDLSQGNAVYVTAVTTTILVVAGAGMLAARYWAVLGFQVILGLQIVVLMLALTRVQKLWLALLLLVMVGLLGWLFWKLIRAMARLQMPERRPREPTR